MKSTIFDEARPRTIFELLEDWKAVEQAEASLRQLGLMPGILSLDGKRDQIGRQLEQIESMTRDRLERGVVHDGQLVMIEFTGRFARPRFLPLIPSTDVPII